MISIVQIPALKDNYSYLIHDDISAKTVVIDPSEAAPVLKALNNRAWRLSAIWNTHHHWDHIGGNLELKEAYQCQIVGSEFDRDRIDGLTDTVQDGDSLNLGGIHAKIISVPGHTQGAITYYIADSKAAFTGDTLFTGGCGRLFEGTPEQMVASLKKLAALPSETLIYCGHEYTESNLEFAATVFPDHPEITKRLESVRLLRAKGQPTVPALLFEELATNPFYLAHSLEAFTKIRILKDNY